MTMEVFIDGVRYVPATEFKFGDRVRFHAYEKNNEPRYGTYISKHSHNPDAPPGQRNVRHFILMDGETEPYRFKSTDFTRAD